MRRGQVGSLSTLFALLGSLLTVDEKIPIWAAASAAESPALELKIGEPPLSGRFRASDSLHRYTLQVPQEATYEVWTTGYVQIRLELVDSGGQPVHPSPSGTARSPSRDLVNEHLRVKLRRGEYVLQVRPKWQGAVGEYAVQAVAENPAAENTKPAKKATGPPQSSEVGAVPTVAEKLKAWSARFVPVLSPTAASRVRVLLACDTDARGGIAPGVRLDQQRVEQFFRDAFRGREQRLDLTVLTGPDVSRNRILSFYQTLDSNDSETLVFYYSGHGGSFSAGGDTQHYLALTHGPHLLRSDLRQAIEHKPHQSAIILTDCCSSHGGYDEMQMKQLRKQLSCLLGDEDPSEMPAGVDQRTVDWLFFRHVGVIDINAASPARDQFSWSSGQTGGLFTYSLIRALRSDVNHINQGRAREDDVVTWAQAFGRVQVWAAALSLGRQGLPPIEDMKKAAPQDRDKFWQWAHAFSFH